MSRRVLPSSVASRTEKTSLRKQRITPRSEVPDQCHWPRLSPPRLRADESLPGILGPDVSATSSSVGRGARLPSACHREPRFRPCASTQPAVQDRYHVFDEQLKWPPENSPWKASLACVPNYGSVEDPLDFARAKFEEDVEEDLMAKMSYWASSKSAMESTGLSQH